MLLLKLGDKVPCNILIVSAVSFEISKPLYKSSVTLLPPSGSIFEKITFLYRKLDQYSWQYCNKGFFNFKNYIPKIISTFN